MAIDTSSQLCTKEAFALLKNVSVATVDRWIEEGKISPAIKIGRRTLFDKTSSVPMSVDTDELITKEQLAVKLGRAVSTINRWLTEGKIKYTRKVGTRCLFHKDQTAPKKEKEVHS
jgi:excisionase family DNA binding protein